MILFFFFGCVCVVELPSVVLVCTVRPYIFAPCGFFSSSSSSSFTSTESAVSAKMPTNDMNTIPCIYLQCPKRRGGDAKRLRATFRKSLAMCAPNRYTLLTYKTYMVHTSSTCFAGAFSSEKSFSVFCRSVPCDNYVCPRLCRWRTLAYLYNVRVHICRGSPR